jgi:hypothetical protein
MRPAVDSSDINASDGPQAPSGVDSSPGGLRNANTWHRDEAVGGKIVLLRPLSSSPLYILQIIHDLCRFPLVGTGVWLEMLPVGGA